MTSPSSASETPATRAVPPLDTARLRLRLLEPADATPAYLGWMRDPEVTRYLEVRHAPPADVEALARFVAAAAADPATYFFGIFAREDGRHIGNIKLGPVDRRNRRADIGYVIGERDRQGRGYASEAIAAVGAFALDTLGLNKVCAGCHAGNVASAKALRKAGFTLEATLRGHWIADGIVQDGLLFALHRPGAGQ